MDVESNGGIGPRGCAKFVATAQPYHLRLAAIQQAGNPRPISVCISSQFMEPSNSLIPGLIGPFKTSLAGSSPAAPPETRG
jgi:hypothetical protein